MIIKRLQFHVFAELFDGHTDLIIGLGFSKDGCVDILTDARNYNWRVATGPSGLVMVWYAVIGNAAWVKLGELCTSDFDEITIY